MITVPAGEMGVLRVFSVDLPADQATAFVSPAAQPPQGSPFAQSIAPGTALDPDFIEALPVSHLATLGHPDLYAFVSAAPMRTADLAHNAAALRAQRGMVVLVWSDAFGGAGGQVQAKSPVHHIATLRMTSPAPRLRPARRLWTPPRLRGIQRAADPRRVRNLVTGLALGAVVLVGFVLVYGEMLG